MKVNLAERLFRFFGFKVEDDELPEEASAIVGIGAGLGDDNAETQIKHSRHLRQPNCSPQTKAVAMEVIRLWLLRGKKEQIFFSGGFSCNDITEAQVMWSFVEQYCPFRFFKYGVHLPIAIETKSKNSLGNAKETINFLLENEYKSAIIVDFQWHLWQMRKIFLKQVIDTDIRLYFVNASASFGGNIQNRINNPWIFLIWEIATTLYYKLMKAI